MILQQLIKGQQDNPLPDSSELADKFADIYINKIMKIRSHFQHPNPYTPQSRNCATLTHFRPTSQEETLEILNSMKKTMSDMDPCNIHFLIEFKEVLLST